MPNLIPLDTSEDIIPAGNFQFPFRSPSPKYAYLNLHFICESASRILFLSINWIQRIPVFQRLSYVFAYISLCQLYVL